MNSIFSELREFKGFMTKIEDFWVLKIEKRKNKLFLWQRRHFLGFGNEWFIRDGL